MAAPKGNKFSPGRPIGSKNRATLIQEERRRIFDEQITQKWEEIIEKLPPTYVADQFLGKAPDKVQHSGEIKTESVAPELLEIAREELKKRMRNGT